MNLTPYHAKYFAYELTKRSSSDSMQKFASTLLDAQVDLNPHQVEAALFAFRSPLSKGAILADEVGLGKTIEAGLVIAQKWAERKRKIFVPANLRKQWSQELIDKFFLPSVILETKSFKEAIRQNKFNPFEQSEIIICSYQFARSKEDYLQVVQWDLVVLDEAHRLKNVYKNSNRIGRSIKQSLAHARKLLLTATPLQNSLLELYGLVSIIDDYAFGDVKSFKSQYGKITGSSDVQAFSELKERLKPLCKRTLRRQVLEYIKYTSRIALVEEFYPTEDEQRLYELVSAYLQRSNLYALPSSQRQLMTLILRKLLASSTYAISGTLEALAGRLEKDLNEQNGQPHSDTETTIGDDFDQYEDIAEEWLDEEPTEPTSENYSPQQQEEIQKEIADIREFKVLADSIRINSKGEKLFTALNRGFEEASRLGANKKAIIFTESVRTQNYLKELLEARDYEGKVVLFNGTNNDPQSREIYRNWLEKNRNSDRVTGSPTADMRAALIDHFKDEATIMVATEAASEGINLQFCSMVINYDLPWNPQRIEQRIGRCHRYGQKYDVVVVNFLNKANAADQRVYQLLNEKFNLFSGVFGASDEVLGSIEAGVDFEKRIAKIYRECRTQEEIQTSFDDLQHELESQISSTLHQTRQKLLENFDEEVHEKLRMNLEESREYLSKYEQWLWDLTMFYLKDDAEFTEGHSFNLKHNPFTDEAIPLGWYQMGKNIDNSHIYRMGHPLAQRIIDTCSNVLMKERTLVFDYSGSAKKIFVLEDLIGKSGWLVATGLTISALETEDYILFAGVTDSGQVLEADQVRRFFSLEANMVNETGVKLAVASLENQYCKQKEEIIEVVNARNGSYFEFEIEKIDKWGEDRRSSLKLTLKDLDEQVKELKKQARQAPNLPEKLKIEKERRKLESERDEAWRNYDQAAREIEKEKDKLIDDIEQKLDQRVKEEILFTIRWQVI